MTDKDFEQLNLLMGRAADLLDKYEVSEEDQKIFIKLLDYVVKGMEQNV